LWTILFTILLAFPIGVGAAIYLEEYASDTWFNRLIQTNINNLAGVPSIVYGILGLAIFVRTLEPLTSGEVFGLVNPTTANGRTVLSAGLTLGLLVLPIIIINAQEAIRAVPRSLRNASFGVGATRWQTVSSPCRGGCFHRDQLRSKLTLFKIYHVADPDLPVDIPSAG
jgi:phosphate transport system permease protein